MSHHFSLLLAWRFIKTAAYERSISVMIRLCFWGILISTFALALVAAVMKGFEYVTTQKLQGIHADLIIRSYEHRLHYPHIQQLIKKEFSNSVEAITPSSMHHMLITSARDTAEPFLVTACAIEPSTLAQVSTIGTTIISPRNIPFTNLFAHNHIIIGKELALQLDVQIGDTVTLWLPHNAKVTGTRLALSHVTARVSGVFATGIDEFDSATIFASQDFMYNTAGVPDGITHVNVKLKPGVNAALVKQQLTKRCAPLEIVSWQDMYAALVSALVLEKYAMIVILSLIVLIASMNTISLLFMYLTSKKRTLAILFAMGLSTQQAMATFITIGFIISCGAAIIGLTLAIATSFIIDHYHLIALPDVYYTSYLPAHMDSSIILITLCLVLVLGILATWYPTRHIKRMDISHILKFEV